MEMKSSDKESLDNSNEFVKSQHNEFSKVLNNQWCVLWIGPLKDMNYQQSNQWLHSYSLFWGHNLSKRPVCSNVLGSALQMSLQDNSS